MANKALVYTIYPNEINACGDFGKTANGCDNNRG